MRSRARKHTNRKKRTNGSCLYFDSVTKSEFIYSCSDTTIDIENT
jgi:hypothetical protein